MVGADMNYGERIQTRLKDSLPAKISIREKLDLIEFADSRLMVVELNK